MTNSLIDTGASSRSRFNKTAYGILGAISLSHLLNDTIQSLLPAIYPLLKDSFKLDYGQIGLLTFTFHVIASFLQPSVGLYTDRHPKPYSLPIGMSISLVGLVILALAPNFAALLLAAALIGAGSGIFHPEASRVARLASGGRRGLAQALFQGGGNIGTSLGPLLAAAVIVPFGQRSIVLAAAIALLAIIVLWQVGTWHKEHERATAARPAAGDAPAHPGLSRRRLIGAFAILIALVFSKFFYIASMMSFYTFYLIEKFGVSVPTSQVFLFFFLGAVGAGTLLGGPIGDRFGQKRVIWASVLGVLPFTLLLPHVGLTATAVLSVVIAMGLASAFPQIVVFGQDLVPGKVGAVSGMFFGLAFGMSGIGAAILGALADSTSIEFVFLACSFLPAIGLLTAFLPNLRPPRA
jgi:FSR family fosmidomycin resistance protein-like MFS transporter